MRQRFAFWSALACSTVLAGMPAFAQSMPNGQQAPGAQPGSIAGSAQPSQPATGTTATSSTPTDQQTGTTTTPATATTNNGDIIVTAQRTETKLSRTPVAIAVVGADTLAKANINTEQDLQLATPGLTVRAGQSSNQLNFALRGQSLDAYSFGRPGVLPYFDEVQVSNPTGSASIFYDLQSVQVLKGPQGTLFGRNSTGGAVLFTTTKPSYDLGGYASVLGGDYGTFKGEGAINVPIVSDEVALRVAGFYSRTNGFQRNEFDNTRRGNDERYGGRGSLRFDFGSFHNTLVADYQHAVGTELVSTIGNLDTNQVGAFPTVALYTPASSDAVLALVLQGFGLPAGAASAIAAGNFQRYLATHPGVNPAGIGAVFAREQATGPFVVQSNSPDRFTNSNLQVSNISTFDLGSNTTIKNVIGYINIKADQVSNVDGTSYLIIDSFGPGITNKATALSEELQLLGNIGNLKYVVGGYYSYETSVNDQLSGEFDVIPFGILTGSSTLYGTTQQNNFTRRNTTYAGYGQGTYDLSDAILHGLSFTAGARYTSEKVRGTTDPGDANIGLATTGLLNPDGSVRLPASAFNNDQSRTYDNVSGTVGINEQVSSNLLVYVASRRSYKNGGFNGLVQPRIGLADASVLPGNAYQQETLTDAEIGTKFNGRLGTMPTTLNIAGYYDWVKNSQRTAFTSVNGAPAAITVNVPKARVYGLEVDGSIDPARWLRLGGTFNYTNAAFTDNLVSIGGATQVFGTYPDTPKYSGGAYTDMTFPADNNVDILLHSDVFAQTKSYFSSTANLNPGAVLPGYMLVNFRVGLQNHTKGWSLTANLKNAFNRVYYVGGLPLAQLVQINSILPGAPQTFTVEFRVKF